MFTVGLFVLTQTSPVLTSCPRCQTTEHIITNAEFQMANGANTFLSLSRQVVHLKVAQKNENLILQLKKIIRGLTDW